LASLLCKLSRWPGTSFLVLVGTTELTGHKDVVMITTNQMMKHIPKKASKKKGSGKSGKVKSGTRRVKPKRAMSACELFLTIFFFVPLWAYIHILSISWCSFSLNLSLLIFANFLVFVFALVHNR